MSEKNIDLILALINKIKQVKCDLGKIIHPLLISD